MSRIPPSSRVRRRLFSEDDVTHQARIDNFANDLQEAIERDKLSKINKWNFDFENEVPLEGTYEWVPCVNNRNDWIGKENTDLADYDVDHEKIALLKMKDENEVTPKTKDDDESMPLLRKRKQDDGDRGIGDKGVRRKISFD